MIEIFKYDGKWRLKIVNETLEFDDVETLQNELNDFITIKQMYEPYKIISRKEEREKFR